MVFIRQEDLGMLKLISQTILKNKNKKQSMSVCVYVRGEMDGEREERRGRGERDGWGKGERIAPFLVAVTKDLGEAS